MPNPYESPSAETKNLMVAGAVRWFATLVWLYPTLLVVAFYGTWLTAWLTLGHMPRPSLDDPKSISMVVDIPHVCTGVLLVGFPAAVLAGVVIQLSITERSWSRRFLRCAVLVVTWIATIAFLRWDPLLVVEWYMD